MVGKKVGIFHTHATARLNAVSRLLFRFDRARVSNIVRRFLTVNIFLKFFPVLWYAFEQSIL